MNHPHERIQALRERRGWSRADLAKKLKATRLWVWRIETGVTKVAIADLPLFARALQCTVEDLVA